MLKFLALALIGAAVTYAQTPHHCMVYPELSFNAQQWNHDYSTFRILNMQYDANGQRVAYYDQESTGPGSEPLLIILLYKEKIGYEFKIKPRTCKKIKVGEFHQWGIPKDAYYTYMRYFGGPGEDVEAYIWQHRQPDLTLDWLGMFSRINCYPMHAFQKDLKTNQTLTTRIFDLVEGFVEPERFEPPTECIKDDVEFGAPSEQTLDIMRLMNPLK